MKTIGLLGGTSWPSTIEYYRILNELAQSRLGGFHSANILLRSIDYHEIKSRYHEGWNEIPSLLRKEIEALARLGPDCLVICNNTLHKAFDVIEADLRLTAPVFHIVAVTGKFARSRHFKRLLLLGTKFTMEDGFTTAGLKHLVFKSARPITKIESKSKEFNLNWQKGSWRRNFENISLALSKGMPTLMPLFSHAQSYPWQ
jgi:aspartate racemase